MDAISELPMPDAEEIGGADNAAVGQPLDVLPRPSFLEALGRQAVTYPDRLSTLISDTDPHPTIEALTDQPQLGQESLDRSRFSHLDQFFPLAKCTEDTGIEYYAPVHLDQGGAAVGQPREGFSGLAPLEAHPEAKERVGTVHTHPNEIPFSPMDVLALLVNKDALMITVTPGGAVNVMIKTGEHIPVNRKIEAILDGAEEVLKSRFRKPFAKLSSEEVQRRVEKLVRWNLNFCKKMGIALYRGEQGQPLERIV